MKKLAFLIMSHGSYSQATIETAEFVIGKQENYETVGIYPEDNILDKKFEIEEKIKKLDTEKGLVILTDIKGGSPFNLAINFLKSDKELVYSGFSLQKLIEILSESDSTLEEIENILRDKNDETSIIKFSDLKGESEDEYSF